MIKYFLFFISLFFIIWCENKSWDTLTLINREEVNSTGETNEIQNTELEELEIKKEGNLVTLVWPKELIKKMNECSFKNWFWYGYTLDWWDGSESSPKDTNCAISHDFNVPWKYIITATLWHPGPTDWPITDWKWEASVEVISSNTQNKKPELTLKITSDSTKNIFYYQELPTVQWEVKNLESKYILDIKAKDLKGNIISNPLSYYKNNKVYYGKEVSYNGKGEFRLDRGENYNSSLNSWQSNFYIEWELKSFSWWNVVISTISKTIRMTGEYNPEGSIAQWVKITTNGKIVTLEKNVFHQECYNYLIDWGDGEKDKNDFSPHTQCKLDGKNMVFSHTYETLGNYTIIMKDNSYDPFSPVWKNPDFIKKQINIQ